MANLKREAAFTSTSLFLLTVLLSGCSGANFPAALSGSSSLTSSAPTSSEITTGTGTGACGDGTAFKQCLSTPVSGGTYTTPLLISIAASSPKNIAGFQSYANGNLITSQASSTPTSGSTNGNWNATYPLAPGIYTIGINTWDDNGNDVLVATASNVNVVASPFTIPTGAKVYQNLQAATGSSGSWAICNGSCSGSSGSGSSGIELNATGVPSLTGGALAETSTGAGYNTLGYLKPPCPTGGCTSISNLLDDVWFYIPATTTGLQALEFDPDIYDGSYEYFLSMQCDSASGNWRFWDMANNNWTDTQNPTSTSQAKYPCKLLTQTGVWHHFQLYGTMNYAAHTYSYQTFAVDGVTIYQNLANSYNAKAYPAPSQAMVVEQQIDNSPTATANTVYYDNYSLTVW